MPIYEYKCNECRKIFDKIRPMKEVSEPIKCPDCGSVDTIRQFTAPAGFVLKGNGFVGSKVARKKR